MDLPNKKTALRMIPYGLYVLTAKNSQGEIGASTVNWVTQASFEPPLVVVGVKADSRIHGIIKEAKSFALNVLGKNQQKAAFAFFKPAEVKGNLLSGEPFRDGSNGAPILENSPAVVECELVDTVEKGDHSIFVGKVIEAHLAKEISGRPDDQTLILKELGEKTFYGG